MKVLVVGVGQVGTFAAHALAEDGHEVVGADLAPDVAFFRRYGPSGQVTINELDVMDSGQIEATLGSTAPDVVVLSFGINGISFQKEPDRAFAVNVRGPINVARAACDTRAVQRIVFLSSFAAYGRQPIDSLSEATKPAPTTQYGEAKLEAERGLEEVCDRRITLRILRPCGLYGPIRHNRGSHSARLIESLLLAAAYDKPVSLQSSALDADEYIYVKDLGRAIACAATANGNDESRVFNVGTGSKTSAAELIDAVKELWPGFSPETIDVPSRHRCAMPVLDISRSRRELGFHPEFELAHGLRDLAMTIGLLR